jgi:hypothetical protein
MNLVDTAVLNLTEGICHRLQRLTGRTNVWLAVQLTNLSIVIYFVWAIAHFWRSALPFRVFVDVFCGLLLYTMTQSIFKVSIETYEASAYRRVSKGLRNPRRVRDGMLRILFLSLSIFLLGPFLFAYINLGIWIVMVMYSLIVLTTIVLYVLACDPLPPCEGKVFEWFRRPAAAPVALPKRVPTGDRSSRGSESPARRSS